MITVPTVILCGILLAGADWQLWVSLVGLNVIVVVLYGLRSLGLWVYYTYYDTSRVSSNTKRESNKLYHGSEERIGFSVNQ